MTHTRDCIRDRWGGRTPFHGEGRWPARVDEHVTAEPDRWVRSCCVLCSNGCGLDIGVKDGRIVGVRGVGTDRVNRGRLGPKGLTAWQANASPDRLTRPLVKDGGAFREASWDEAMSLVVTRCRETMADHTPGAVGIYNTGQLFHEEYYTLAMIAYAGIGTNQVDGNTRLCTATASQALRETFGCDGQPGSYTDVDETDCLLLVGSNMAETQTVLWARVLDRLAGPAPPRLVVVDPRRTPTAARATVHLRPRLGTNVALLNGLLHLLIAGGHADHKFLAKHTQGFDRLAAVVGEYPPERVEQLTGVPAAELVRAADVIGTSAMLVSCVLQGVYQSNQATAAACQVNNVNLVLGRIGRPGCGVLQMNGQPTAQNCRECGCDGEFPFFLNWQNPDHVARWARLWNVDPLTLPHWHQHAHAMEIFRHAEVGSVKFLWVIGTNPAVSLPELHRVRGTLAQDRLFLVVQDAFLTETAALADVVLPAAIWGEKTGTFTNVDRTVHVSHRAIDPPGEARADLDIFLDFARRMGFTDKAGKPLVKWKDAAGAFAHWAKSSKGWFCDYSGLTYDKLSAGSGVQWPCTRKHPDGCERLYTGKKFHTAFDKAQTFGHDLETGAARTPDEYRADDPAGRALLKAAHYRPPQEAPDADYPFFLTTGRVVYHFHTRTKTGRTPELQAAAPDVFVELCADDADRLGVADGDEVEVASRRGTVRGPARIGDILPGHVFIPFHYGYWDAAGGGHHRAANELTISGWDPVSKQPYFKYAAVQVRKARTALAAAGEVVADAAAKVAHRAKAAADGLLAGTHPTPRSHVPDGIGLLRAALGQFAEACRALKEVHFTELELVGCWETFAQWCDALHARFEPFAARYGETPSKEPEQLRRTLFPAARPGEFGELRDLQSLELLAAAVHGANTVLVQVAQGLRDRELLAAALEADEQVRRIQAWAQTQVKHRSVHSLLVPM
ncbi:MAG: molybdopterin-dependent oxidoreductase [Gemmataceae bacterium]